MTQRGPRDVRLTSRSSRPDYARLLDGVSTPKRSPRSPATVGPSGARGTWCSSARGTSDHAALYGAYLTEIRLGIPVGAGLAQHADAVRRPAGPVRSARDRGQPDRRLARPHRGADGRPRAGALTLAVTNNPDSPLCKVAELRHRRRRGSRTGGGRDQDLHRRAAGAAAAGRGRSGPVTARCRPRNGPRSLRCPGWPRATLADRGRGHLAQRYRFASRMVTTGRGYAYPTARETALKLMETSYLPALAFSGADLLHGPVAMTDPDVPVLAVVGVGPGGAAMKDVVTRLANGAQTWSRSARPTSPARPAGGGAGGGRAVRGAARHPAVAAAGAGARAGPRRGPGRTRAA